jgi:hypothetical protein
MNEESRPAKTALRHADSGPRIADGVETIRDALARVVWMREEFDPLVREQALEDLELDLAAELAQLEERAA